MDYKSKKEEMKKKYGYAVKALSMVHGVDEDVAFEMLESNITRGGQYAYVNVAEFLKDHDELNELAK